MGFMQEVLGFVCSSVSFYFEVVVTQISTPHLSKTFVNQSVLLFYSSVGQVKIKEECVLSYHQEHRKRC